MTAKQMNGEMVLVVDDEENIRNLVQLMLRSAGYDVDAAANGKEALSKVEESDIGVMILDIKMPGMSGLEVLQEATTRWPDICILMLTAVSDLDTAIKAMKLGAYDYITKPFKRDDLISKLQQAVEQRNLITETEARNDNMREIWPIGLRADDWEEKREDE